MEAVILNSGGMDTAVAMGMAAADGHILHSIFIDLNPYNSERAKVAAQHLADLYCIDHIIFPFPFDWTQPTNNLYGVRGTQYLTTSIASAYAMKLGVNYVICGLKAESNASPWMDKLADILAENLLTTVPILLAPLKDMSSDDLFAKAQELNIDLNPTCSCGRGPMPDGTCTKCLLRIAHGIALN